MTQKANSLSVKQHEDIIRVPPVDFSFKKLETLQGMSSSNKPRGGRVKIVPNRGPKNNFVTAGIWLNNNYLQSTEFLAEMVENTLEYPERLAWLDLSFNKINTITPDVTKFPNLKILYLHGNNIQDLQAVMTLQPITTLRTLTLHGNPIETIPSYRAYVVKIVKSLMNLDFTTIAPRERGAPLPAGLADVLQMSANAPKKKSIKNIKTVEPPKEETPKQEEPVKEC